ncbi:hypothetical protein [Pseudonocardia alni]|uniref:hypothetical protein n=1 Tax=Pseudonocardia alni TaxID=33907 RepID=UPI0033C1C577
MIRADGCDEGEIVRRSLLAVLSLVVAFLLLGSSVALAQDDGNSEPPPPTCGVGCIPQDPNAPPPPPTNPNSPIGRAFAQVNERITQIPAGPRRAFAERVASRVQNRLCHSFPRFC